MPTTPPIIISYEADKSINEMNEKLINITKELYSKHILKSKIKKTKNGLPIYECINKINNLECKGIRADRKGTGLVLQKGDKCFDCQFDGVP